MFLRRIDKVLPMIEEFPTLSEELSSLRAITGAATANGITLSQIPQIPATSNYTMCNNMHMEEKTHQKISSSYALLAMMKFIAKATNEIKGSQG